MPIAIDIPKLSPRAAYYTVKRGQARGWLGSPLTQTDVYFDNPAGSTNVLLVDRNFPGNVQTVVYHPVTGAVIEDGNEALESWAVYQANPNTADYPIPVGDVKCLIMSKDPASANFIVHAIGEMTHPISQQGVVEFDFGAGGAQGGLNRFIGLWIKAYSKFRIGYMKDTTGEGLANPGSYQKSGVAEPALETAMGDSNYRDLTGRFYCMSARTSIKNISTLTQFWIHDGAGDDIYGWYNFVLNTNAFADASVTNPANAFDTTTSVASVAIGATGNIYYNLDGTIGLCPVARVGMIIPTLVGAAARATIYTSENITVAKTLVGAQAITAAEWVEVATVHASDASAAYEYHVGRKARWLRLEIVAGPTATGTVQHFEARLVNLEIGNGVALPHPSSTLKDRILIDENSHTEARFYTSTLPNGASSSGNSPLQVAATGTSFYNQFPIGGFLVVRDSGTLGQSSVSGWSAAVRGKNVAAQTIDIGSGPGPFYTGFGKSFLSGSFIEPAPWWYQVTAWNAANQVIAVSNWIGNSSCVALSFRSDAPFSTVGK